MNWLNYFLCQTEHCWFFLIIFWYYKKLIRKIFFIKFFINFYFNIYIIFVIIFKIYLFIFSIAGLINNNFIDIILIVGASTPAKPTINFWIETLSAQLYINKYWVRFLYARQFSIWKLKKDAFLSFVIKIKWKLFFFFN